jgi:hypothetical protein
MPQSFHTHTHSTFLTLGDAQEKRSYCSHLTRITSSVGSGRGGVRNVWTLWKIEKKWKQESFKYEKSLILCGDIMKPYEGIYEKNVLGIKNRKSSSSWREETKSFFFCLSEGLWYTISERECAKIVFPLLLLLPCYRFYALGAFDNTHTHTISHVEKLSNLILC